MDTTHLVNKLIEASAFSMLGVVVFIVSYILFDKLTPGDLSKEIAQKNNLPLAILASSVLIGIAIIIGAAIHG